MTVTLLSYIVFIAMLVVISVLLYWVLNWRLHSRKDPSVDYTGFKGFLRWGYKLRWNMTAFALAIVIFNTVTAPDFIDKSLPAKAPATATFT